MFVYDYVYNVYLGLHELYAGPPSGIVKFCFKNVFVLFQVKISLAPN